jgi:hypothetical protein
MRIELTDEDDHFGQYWTIVEDDVQHPVWTEKALANAPHLKQEYEPAPVGLFYSEAVANRVAELIKDDAQLRELLAEEEPEEPSS